MSLGLSLHVLATAIWLGGLFFAYAVLRPSAYVLEPTQQLTLSHRALGRFFVWAWISVGTLIASGFAMLLLAFGGFAAVPLHVRAMMALGVASVLAFAYLYFAPWRRFARAVHSTDWTSAERKLRQVRYVVAALLVLAAVAAVIGAGGRYYA
jgi:uncharacterized membrane protein